MDYWASSSDLSPKPARFLDTLLKPCYFPWLKHKIYEWDCW
jgi:hypothetical protein